MTLRSIIEAYLEKPGRYYFYNVATGESAYGTLGDYEAFCDGEKYDDGQGNWHCYESRSPSFMKWLRSRFLSRRHVPIEDDLLKAGPFNAFLRRKGWFSDWVDYYFEENAFFLARHALENELEEEEASPSTYRDIQKLMKEYDNENFQDCFSDSLYFTLVKDRVYATFFVLGASHDTYGLCLYLSEWPYQEVSSFLRCPDYHDRRNDIGMLTTFLGLYAERGEGEKPSKDYPNPYGGDRRVSSMLIHRGKRSINRLSKTLGCAVKQTLREIIDALKWLRDNPDRPEEDEDANVVIRGRGKGYSMVILPRDEDELYRDEFFIDRLLANIDSPRYETGAKTRAEYAFTFRFFPGGNFDYEDDPRNGFCAFAGFLMDLSTGKLLPPILVSMEHGETFGQALYSAAKQLKGIKTPKTIVVNNELDEHIADFFFVPWFVKGTEIEFLDEDLPTDDAFDELARCVEEGTFDDLPQA